MSEQVRIDQLERATVRLGEQVGGLSASLSAITEIQAKQVVMDERQSDLEATVVPRSELDKRAQQINRDLLAYRRQVLHRVYGGGVLLVGVLLAVGVLVSNYLQSREEAALQQCRARNVAVSAARQYFVAVKNNSTNPTLVSAADKALLTYAPINCEASS